MSPMIHAHQLTVEYPTPDGVRLVALGPLTVEIPTGQFLAIVGPSGCGKSTFIRVLAGLQPPTHGTASLGDVPITAPSPRVGLMFQSANLMPWRTVSENMALPLELAGISRSEQQQVVAELLPTLGLTGFEKTYPAALSGGMAQRVALGRLLASQPDVLLLDEPFGALDALTRERLGLDLLQMWSRGRQTVVMVTHNITEATLLADRVVVFSRRPGKIIADVPVPLPRPRAAELAYTTHFVEVARQIRAAIDHA